MIENKNVVDITSNISTSPYPPGPGAGDLNYVYTQATASGTWEVTHNLEKYPSVTVVDSSGTTIMPNEVKYDSNNKVTIIFLAQFTGKAYLN